jgi:isochorismate hydrolase
MEHRCGCGRTACASLTARTPTANETVLRKVRDDAFYGTPLDHQLRVCRR